MLRSLSSTSSGRWVWAVFLSCLAAPIWGAGGVEVVPSLVDGVKIEGPNSEGFHQQFVARIAHVPPGSGLAALESYHVRISNTGSRAIVRFVVRSERLNKDGHPVAGTFVRDFPFGHRFSPGSTDFLIGVSANSSSSFLQSLAATPYVRASVDAVVFEDGEFVGPDVGGNFANEKAHGERLTSLLTELNTLGLESKDAVLARLDPLLKSELTLDRVVASQLKFTFSLPDQGRTYFRMLTDLAADPAVWRSQ